MKTRFKSDRIVLRDALFDGFVYVSDGRIAGLSAEAMPADEEYDFTGLFLSPGFIDIHTHGGGGHAFADSDPAEVIAGCDFHLSHGTTSILPTVSSSPFADMKRSLENIAEAMRSGGSKANIIGAHLEGPYLSPAQSGAQHADYLTPPNPEEYLPLTEEYLPFIKRWTYAPELDRGGEFCRFLTDRGIIASPGHTDAKYSDMLTAAESGAKLVTHLYSCTSTVTRKQGFRTPGVIESVFLLDAYTAEIIADGRHLPPEIIKMILKIKGPDRVIAVTDSLSVAGSEIKSGTMCGTDFIIEEGVARLPDRSAFVGSIATGDILVRTLVRDCGLALPEALRLVSANPARLLGLGKGEIREGFDADLAVFDGSFDVSDVFVAGKRVSGI